jgi:hypothetical protein
MTGFRTDRGRVGLFAPEDQVRTASGRRGIIVKLIHAGTAAVVRWDDGEEFAIMLSHLEHDDRFFGGETSHRPGA